MAKNIVIFSDGTGQGGGLLPDENRSNVYKLFRAARVCPDTTIDPAKQVAFYDPGLGSQAAGSGIKVGWWRRIYNVLSSATGLGYTQNIIDCYAAIVRVWEPGDRIYLIGFSRGAYTVRCVAGVLRHCGVPTQLGPGQPLKRDPATVSALATRAVKHVYQFGNSLAGDPYESVRTELSQNFRRQHASSAPNDATLSNAYPYFIGVWDTVAALGLAASRVLLLGFSTVVLIGLLAVIFDLILSRTVFGDLFDASLFWTLFCSLWGMLLAGGLILYAINYTKFATGVSVPWFRTLHTTGLRVELYDTVLSRHVQHARHALSIDENRADFDKVAWTYGNEIVTTQEKGDYTQLVQMWFAGVHSDVGGSYSENEARLSDIALKWMIDEATRLPKPLEVDRSLLNLWPSASGLQHDERKSTVAAWPAWFTWLLMQFQNREDLGWKPGLRKIPRNAPLHPTVLERFQVQDGVLHYDVRQPYRPEGLRLHRDTHTFYPTASPPAGA